RSTLLRQRWYCSMLCGVSRTAGAAPGCACSVMRSVDGGDLLPSVEGNEYSCAGCAWAAPSGPSRHARARPEIANIFMTMLPRKSLADAGPGAHASRYRNVAPARDGAKRQQTQGAVNHDGGMSHTVRHRRPRGTA